MTNVSVFIFLTLSLIGCKNGNHTEKIPTTVLIDSSAIISENLKNAHVNSEEKSEKFV
jgi:hypothetical protein